VSWITTYTGIHFDFLNPTVSMLRIEDIAHALARLCRFNGHCKSFYSVAEHSVHVAYTLSRKGAPNDDIRLGLMHDAAEAYVGDVPTPLKRLLPAYANIEKRVQEVIAEKFNLSTSAWDSVSRIDHAIFYAEAKVMLPEPPPKPEDLPEIEAPIEGWNPVSAEKRFMAAFERWF
jgi:hypothetical protein